MGIDALKMHENIGPTPHVCIVLATAQIGGPGKGVLMFLDHAKNNRFNYTLCNFSYKGNKEYEFLARAKIEGYKLSLIRQNWVFDPAIISRLSSVIKSNGCNIIQTHGYKPSILGLLMKTIYGIPWVSFSHGFTNDNLKIWIYNRLESQIIKYADVAVGVSKAICNRLEASGVPTNKICLVYNAIDDKGLKTKRIAQDIRLQYGISTGTKVIGVVGRLNPEKGHIVFLKAFQKIQESCGKVKCLIIGEGQERIRLEKYCKDHDLSGYVVFTGYHENIADFYQVLDLLVMPSFSEGLPNALLEAMLFGVPVIATMVGGIPEVIDCTNGILVRAGDHEAMASRMLELLKNEKMAKEIGQAGKVSLFPKFSPSLRTDIILGLYRKILERRGRKLG